MIATLRGRVVDKGVDSITLEVGQIGYRVFVPLLAMSQIPLDSDEQFLHIHTHVREDALLLYGFPTTGEKALFRQLIGISGVGPKQALNILGGMEAEDFVNAIQHEDYRSLSKIPGVGKKTAERLCYELKDKLAGIEARVRPAIEGDTNSRLLADLQSALGNLGYKPKQVDKVTEAMQKAGIAGDFQTLLREALKRLR